MIELLIIADDLTGALDTGIQFAKKGIETRVVCKRSLPLDKIKDSAQVLVIDAETRPAAAEEAYDIVYSLVCQAVDQGILHIYKKTDSALRGNVGAELKALVDAAGAPAAFLPAYPDAGRTTRAGCHYVNGVPLKDSVFGKDPFEPVKHSYIPDILKEQGMEQVCCVRRGEKIPSANGADVYLFDAEENNDICERVQELREQKMLGIAAGCAGFAAFLPEALGLKGVQKTAWKKKKGLYVACGSLNPVTERQLVYAEAHDFVRVHLAPAQKLEPAYYDTAEGRKFMENIYKICINNPGVIVDSFDRVQGETQEYARSRKIESKDIRYLITRCHGRILHYLMECRVSQTYLLTGGDTLMGFLSQLPNHRLRPEDELFQGVVLSALKWDGRLDQVISKSGGFGEEDLLIKLKSLLVENKGDAV